jgi:murein DD-endopeptidase MepM/ murein hydrolase activator NlpD
MISRISRRSLLAGAAASAFTARSSVLQAQGAGWDWIVPIRYPDRIPGDGFYLRHGFATENTVFYPGGWHTGENWYALEGDTAGVEIIAVADGEIVYAGFDYPGPVVIVRHAENLYSMYGHLDYDLDVESGPVMRGQRIGRVLNRTDGRSPSHVHFEIRRFLTSPEVNGNAPRYSFTCGLNCPPGPGYWPIDAPEHPTGMGWLNPTHAVATRAFPGGVPDTGVEVVVATGARELATLWSASPDAAGAENVGEISLVEGERYVLRGIDSGPEDTTETSSESYRLSYQIEVPNLAGPAWVEALYPSSDAFGSDGRPSSLRFDFLPMADLS